MAKRATRKKQRKKPQASEKQLLLLGQLKELVAGLGTEVREERLLREVGYSVRSGPCRIDGQEIVLLDSHAAAAEHIEVLLDFLADQDLDQVYIEPGLREIIGGRSDADADAHGDADSATAAVEPAVAQDDGAPVERAEGTPREHADAAPVEQADGTPVEQADGTPREHADAAPVERAEGTPGERAEGTPVTPADAAPVTPVTPADAAAVEQTDAAGSDAAGDQAADDDRSDRPTTV